MLRLHYFHTDIVFTPICDFTLSDVPHLHHASLQLALFNRVVSTGISVIFKTQPKGRGGARLLNVEQHISHRVEKQDCVREFRCHAVWHLCHLLLNLQCHVSVFVSPFFWSVFSLKLIMLLTDCQTAVSQRRCALSVHTNTSLIPPSGASLPNVLSQSDSREGSLMNYVLNSATLTTNMCDVGTVLAMRPWKVSASIFNWWTEWRSFLAHFEGTFFLVVHLEKEPRAPPSGCCVGLNSKTFKSSTINLCGSDVFIAAPPTDT